MAVGNGSRHDMRASDLTFKVTLANGILLHLISYKLEKLEGERKGQKEKEHRESGEASE